MVTCRCRKETIVSGHNVMRGRRDENKMEKLARVRYVDLEAQESIWIVS